MLSFDSVDPITAAHRRKLRIEIRRARAVARSGVSVDGDSSNVGSVPLCRLNNTSLFLSQNNVAPILEDRKEARRLKNRQSAIASRQKKNEVISVLSSEIEKLRAKVAGLKRRLAHYEDDSELDEDCHEVISRPLKRRFVDRVITEPAVFF